MFVPLVGVYVPLSRAALQGQQHQFHARMPMEEPPHHVKALAVLLGRSASSLQHRQDGECSIGSTFCNGGCIPIGGVCCDDITYV